MSKKAEEAALEAYPDKELNGCILIFDEQRYLYQKGYEQAEKTMMEHAVECTVKVDEGGYPYIDRIELYDYTEDKPIVKKGDKVKIIVVKE